MPDRAGYQVSVYAIDVSASMGEVIDDPTGSSSSTSKKTKLDYVKEFVARKCEPKVRASYMPPPQCSSQDRSQVVGRLSILECFPSVEVSARCCCFL
jgi:hypothetical protein